MELKGGKKGREREKGILVKNGQPAREDSLGLRRELRPCSARDLSLFFSLHSFPTYCFFKKMYKVARAPRERKLLAMFATYMCRMFLGDVQQRVIRRIRATRSLPRTSASQASFEYAHAFP